MRCFTVVSIKPDHLTSEPGLTRTIRRVEAIVVFQDVLERVFGSIKVSTSWLHDEIATVMRDSKSGFCGVGGEARVRVTCHLPSWYESKSLDIR